MKKEFIKSILVFFLLGIVLTGCQEKVDTPVENASSNSESTEGTNHNHSHSHNHDDEKQKEIYSGIFEDNEVEDRELSDWEGDWQSVYPYLLDGTLDEVLQKKVETNKDKTFEEYKEYYK